MAQIHWHNDFVQIVQNWLNSEGDEEEEKLADKIREDSRDKMGERCTCYGLIALSLAESWFDRLDPTAFMNVSDENLSYPPGVRLALLWDEQKGNYWAALNSDGDQINLYGKTFPLSEKTRIIAVQDSRN